MHLPHSEPNPADGSDQGNPADDVISMKGKKKSSRSPKRRWIFPMVFGLLDILSWGLYYGGISVLTGGYNIITPDALLLPPVILMFSVALIGGYRYRMDFASLRYASEHLITCFCAYLLAAFAVYVISSFGPNATSSRAILTAATLGFALFSLMTRRVYWFSDLGGRSEGKFLVIVDRDFGPLFYRDYLSSKQHQRVHYLAADLSMLGTHLSGEGSPLLRVEAAHLLLQLRTENISDFEAIVIASRFTHLDKRVLERLGVIHFEEMPVYLMESFYENYWHKFPVELLGPSWPLETDFILVQHSVYSAIKRVLDFLVALLGLILATPLMLLASAAVLILDGWPLIYSQQRVGVHGIPFTLYKFRSMKVGSDKGDGYTRDGDSRVSRVGSFLRKTRLDELPQLWNVLRGDMSMIGPRAEWVRLVAEYEREIPHYHFRHLVRPGITGWAQVNYPYGASLADTIEKFSFDLYYIRNFSIRLDAEVLLKTLHVMSFGKGR
jgi:exopolysaccharide biosynthesis polyprenyl glycosylphosphotransferase